MTPLCPSCRRAVLSRDQNPCFPFCSDRCKAIDLGRWLGGEYRIPVSTEDDDDGAQPSQRNAGPGSWSEAEDAPRRSDQRTGSAPPEKPLTDA